MQSIFLLIKLHHNTDVIYPPRTEKKLIEVKDDINIIKANITLTNNSYTCVYVYLSFIFPFFVGEIKIQPLS